MITNISLVEWIKRFTAGAFKSAARDVQIEAGWYDWFCKDSSLAGKTARLGPKVIKISGSKKFDAREVYVFFKNNCPMFGNLYDDFRICDRKTGDVLYTIIPRSGHTSDHGRAEVWGRENDFKGPLVEGSWADVLYFFLG